MNKATALSVIAVLSVACILAATWFADALRDENRRRNTTVVTCEGDYRVFMRGDQFEVLYDPDCLKVAKI